jgi:hypothetical protein
MTGFQFTGAARHAPTFLTVRAGCHVRIRDISVVGLGPVEIDGQEVVSDRSVALTLVNGVVAYFDPCESLAAAAGMAEDLTMALVKAEANTAEQLTQDGGAG